jgi:hypothetical protein
VLKIFKNRVYIFISQRRLEFSVIFNPNGGGAAGTFEHQRRRLRNLKIFSAISGGGSGSAATLTPLSVLLSETFKTERLAIGELLLTAFSAMPTGLKL